MSVRSKPFAVFCLSVSFSVAVATLAVAADPLVHTVRKGETLYAIAKRYDVSVDSLLRTNGIADAGRLIIGMKLTIPGSSSPSGSVPEAAIRSSREYTVIKGDTLYGIAKAHGVSVDEIVKASGMATTVIKVGQKLKIPSISSPVASSGATPVPGASSPGGTSGGTSGGTAGATATTAAPAPGAPTTPAIPSSIAGKSWPVQGSVSYLQGKLNGVSISAEPASPILAIRSGTVISAGPFRGYGLVAYVESPDGLVYVYGGAASLTVRLGDRVRKGSMIGKVASDEDAAAILFVFKDADTIDPNIAPRD
ncbi:MAG: M23 family metallopeptidase [Spirochaetes bacterium]|nr:M23 family metallopeptidase [Spirochaetota bacterium]MBU1081207.1 M23 family metallopeptidase [Spirochaetota bacterium]